MFVSSITSTYSEIGPPRQREEGSDYYWSLTPFGRPLTAKLLLALVGSKSHGTHNHILLLTNFSPVLVFEPRWDPWPYFSFHTLRVLK
jgi:hypothetical protein